MDELKKLTEFEIQKIIESLEGRARYLAGRYQDYEEANLLLSIKRKFLDLIQK